MTLQEMTALAEDCFAAFNAAPPKGKACEIWAEQCAYVTFESTIWIREKLINRESLPRQFGLEVQRLFTDWKSERGIKQGQQKACPNCDLEIPGFFFGWKNFDGHMYKLTFRCHCNKIKEYQHLECKHKKQAELEGFTVMPEGYRKGSGLFEAELFGYKRGGQNKQELLQRVRNAQKVRVRPDHKRQLQENRLW